MAKPPPKLFSLFNPKPPLQQINPISTTTTTSSSTSALPSSTTTTLKVPLAAPLDVPLPKVKSRASTPSLPKKEVGKIKRKRIIESPSDDGEDEAKDQNSSGSTTKVAEADEFIVVPAALPNIEDNSEVINSIESTKEVELASSLVTKGKGKEKSIMILSDDDEVVIMESASSSSSSSRPKVNSKSASSPKRRKINSSSLTKASTSTLSNVIIIPDSPPKKSSSLFSMSNGTGTGFLPLSEIYRSSREKRIANEPVEVRWPNQEEHGIQHDYFIDSVRPSLERWTSLEGKGKGKEIDASEVDKLELLQSLTLSVPNLSSSSIPSTEFIKAPKLHYHPLHLVKELLPSHIPSHPLLNRLKEPFLVDHPYPSSFTRIHDRDNDEVMNQEGSSTVNFKDMLSVKYAPKSAGEVLGTTSGESAKLLKEWLEELALTSGADDGLGEKKRKPRKINREVKTKSKRRKADSDDGWIVSDEEDDEFYESSDGEDEGDYAPRETERLHRITFPTLSNLILLVGPVSSGKTSSVQAIANELGWDIFEVYPGIGKRSSKDIERYVGDVGKNHLVLGASSDSKGKDPFSMFKSVKIPAIVANGQSKEAAPLAQKTRQSLILFDEVDIVYREDKEFWLGITTLAQECRRPIILTCNDIPNVPDFEGLQKIVRNERTQSHLRFEPPESSIAVPFLQLVSLSEGHLLPESTIRKLYESDSKMEPTPAALLHYDGQPEARFATIQNLPEPDLRRALTQLQFDSQWALGNSAIAWMDFTPNRNGRTAWSVPQEVKVKDKTEKIEVDQVKDENALAREVLATEAVSYSDAYISTRFNTIIEDFEPELNVNSADTEVNYAQYLDRPLAHSKYQLPSAKSTGEVDSYLTDSAMKLRHQLFSKIDKSEDVTMQNQLQSTQLNTIAISFDSHLVDPLRTFTSASDLNTYYLPLFRCITIADDLRKIIHDSGEGGDEEEQGMVGIGRGLRRSTRYGNAFRRNIEWEDGLAELVRASGFSGE